VLRYDSLDRTRNQQRISLIIGTISLYVEIEVSTAVTMKNYVFCDVTPCGSCKSRRFEGTYRLHYQGDNNRRRRNNVTSNQQLKHAVKIDAIHVTC
jgi:hypothetical protein